MAPLHIRRAPAHGLVALAWLSIQCGGARVRSSFSFEFLFALFWCRTFFFLFRLDALVLVFGAQLSFVSFVFSGST